MKITQVLGTRVLVKVLDTTGKTETDSGLVIAPASINPSYFTGEVLLVGMAVDSDVAAGNKVAFTKYGYEDMGDGQYIVEENSLLAVYE